MGGSQTQVALEVNAPARPPAPNKGSKHITGYEVADILRWHAQGLTQEQIAAKFTPPKSQPTISRVLARYGLDQTHEAKRILRGGAADMALHIVRKGRPQDHIAALKGLGVLQDEQSQGVTVLIGGDINISFSSSSSRAAEVIDAEPSPLLTAGTGESTQNP